MCRGDATQKEKRAIFDRSGNSYVMATFAENPLVALFAAKSINVLGTVAEPLFRAIDVAQYVHDEHYNRVIRKYGPKLKIKIRQQSAVTQVTVVYLTELGLYQYLLQSRRPAVKAFQEFVYDALVAVRKSVIDAAQLEAKIAHSRRMRGPSKLRETFDGLALRAHLDRIRLGVLYFIRAGAFVKIGWTTHLPTRLRKLQTGSPDQFEIVAAHICVHPRKYEKRAHAYFVKRHRGEWFEVSDDEIRDYVKHLREEAALV